MIVILSVYALSIAYAMWTDATTLTIPNWVSIILVFAFIAFAIMNLDVTTALWHVGIAAIVFVVTFFFYALGWMGAGDVKFVSATSIWMGQALILDYVLNVALLGAAAAIFLIVVRVFADQWRGWAAQVGLIARVIELAESRKVPYGLPIGAAALVAAPQVFGM